MKQGSVLLLAFADRFFLFFTFRDIDPHALNFGRVSRCIGQADEFPQGCHHAAISGRFVQLYFNYNSRILQAFFDDLQGTLMVVFTNRFQREGTGHSRIFMNPAEF